jgi:mRNA interferase MazF
MPGRCTRGTILQISLDPTVCHEIKKSRPCLVVQNDIGNKYSPMTIVVPIEGAEHVPRLFPVNVLIPKGEGGLDKDSVALCNQIRCVDEARFGKTYGVVSATTMGKVAEALKISLDLK